VDWGGGGSQFGNWVGQHGGVKRHIQDTGQAHRSSHPNDGTSSTSNTSAYMHGQGNLKLAASIVLSKSVFIVQAD